MQIIENQPPIVLANLIHLIMDPSAKNAILIVLNVKILLKSVFSVLLNIIWNLLTVFCVLIQLIIVNNVVYGINVKYVKMDIILLNTKLVQDVFKIVPVVNLKTNA